MECIAAHLQRLCRRRVVRGDADARADRGERNDGQSSATAFGEHPLVGTGARADLPTAVARRVGRSAPAGLPACVPCEVPLSRVLASAEDQHSLIHFHHEVISVRGRREEHTGSRSITGDSEQQGLPRLSAIMILHQHRQRLIIGARSEPNGNADHTMAVINTRSRLVRSHEHAPARRPTCLIRKPRKIDHHIGHARRRGHTQRRDGQPTRPTYPKAPPQTPRQLR